MRNEGIVELYAPRRTLIGRDGITKIPHFLQRLSSKCVLVVTDKGLIKVGPAGKVPENWKKATTALSTS